MADWENLPGMTTALALQVNQIIAQLPPTEDLASHLNMLKTPLGVTIEFINSANGTGYYDHKTNKIFLNQNQTVLVQANTFLFESYNAHRRLNYTSAFQAKGQRRFKEAASGIVETEYQATKEFADLANFIPAPLQDASTQRVLTARRGGGTAFIPGSAFKAAFMAQPHDSTATDHRSLPSGDMYYFENLSGAGANQIQKFLKDNIIGKLPQGQKGALDLALTELLRYWPASSATDYEKARVRRYQHALDRLENFFGMQFPEIRISQAMKSYVNYAAANWSGDPKFKPTFRMQDANPFSQFPSGT